jgi:hypothetical protein
LNLGNTKIAGSANGRPIASGAMNLGSNPSPAAMSCKKILVMISIISNLVGTFLLYKNGLPSPYHNPPTLLLQSDITEEQILENKKTTFYSRIGLFLMMAGTLIQAVLSF